MDSHPHPVIANTPAAPVSGRRPRARRQAHAIHRLREVLFELQCAPDPDPVAIDALMRRLARVRARGPGIDVA